MRGGGEDWRLRVARTTFVVLGVAAMALGVVDATSPMYGLEEFAGTSFAELQASDQKIADVLRHDAVEFGLIVSGLGFLIVVLAWRGPSRGSRLAWYALLILAATILTSAVFAHVPVGITSLAHLAEFYIVFPIYLTALALAAKPVFAPGESKPAGSA